MLPNSAAIPLPTAFYDMKIPLPAGPTAPYQLIDIHEINDIESALSGCRTGFSPCWQGKCPLEDGRLRIVA
jgi:hypothetical protein